jgi:hypothetical protein
MFFIALAAAPTFTARLGSTRMIVGDSTQFTVPVASGKVLYTPEP